MDDRTGTSREPAAPRCPPRTRKIELTIEILRRLLADSDDEATVADRRVHPDPAEAAGRARPAPYEREHVNYESACGHQIGFLSGILS